MKAKAFAQIADHGTNNDLIWEWIVEGQTKQEIVETVTRQVAFLCRCNKPLGEYDAIGATDKKVFTYTFDTSYSFMDDSSSEIEYVNIEDGHNDIIKCCITFIKQQESYNYAHNSSQIIWNNK